MKLISVSAMRASLLLLAVLASSQASSISEVLVKEQWKVSPQGHPDKDYKHYSTQAWKAKNGKEYQNHEEERFRMKIWMENMEKMEKHNEQYYQVGGFIYVYADYKNIVKLRERERHRVDSGSHSKVIDCRLSTSISRCFTLNLVATTFPKVS